MRPAGITVYKSSWLLSETHTKRQATQHDFMPSLLGDDGTKGIVYGEEKIFCTVPTRAAKQEQKSLVPLYQAEQTKQGRTPVICTLWVPIHRSCNGRQGPPLSSLSGYPTPASFACMVSTSLPVSLPCSLPTFLSFCHPDNLTVPSSLCSLFNPNCLWWVHIGISLKERHITEEQMKVKIWKKLLIHKLLV